MCDGMKCVVINVNGRNEMNSKDLSRILWVLSHPALDWTIADRLTPI